jgi:hypothetical protein
MSKSVWWRKLERSALLLPALVGCSETRACDLYACSTSVEVGAVLECPSADAVLHVTLCHGGACSEGSIVWAEEPVCTGNLVESPNADGFSERRQVCATRSEGALVLSGHWDFGREGTPAETAFSLRVADGRTGQVLLDGTARARFGPGPFYDHCHECMQASIDFGPGTAACSGPMTN